LATQRKINCLGTGAEIEAPKALKSETPKAMKAGGEEWGGGITLRSGLWFLTEEAS